jgi:hypothetical protein
VPSDRQLHGAEGSCHGLCHPYSWHAKLSMTVVPPSVWAAAAGRWRKRLRGQHSFQRRLARKTRPQRLQHTFSALIVDATNAEAIFTAAGSAAPRKMLRSAVNIGGE